MGIGDYLVPVPVTRVPADIDNNGEYIIALEETVFNQAPDLASTEWEAEARGYFNNPSNLTSSSMPIEKTEEGMGSGC